MIAKRASFDVALFFDFQPIREVLPAICGGAAFARRAREGGHPSDARRMKKLDSRVRGNDGIATPETAQHPNAQAREIHPMAGAVRRRSRLGHSPWLALRADIGFSIRERAIRKRQRD
ncbi:MAG: hypothetical protein WD069_00810 [Planctomycetales bacterium]